MKKTLLTLLLLSLTALPALAQPLSKEEYLGRWQRLTERVGVAGVGVETLIGQWAEAWPDDVQMLLARFSFYYNKSQSAKVIQLSQDRYLGRAPLLPMKDSTGAVRNYFEDTVFDDQLFGQAEEAISRAIALQPLRLDWRLVRITALTASVSFFARISAIGPFVVASTAARIAAQTPAGPPPTTRTSTL